MFERAVTTALWLVIANFVYEAFTAHAWMVATERSYFQVMALLIFSWSYYKRAKFN